MVYYTYFKEMFTRLVIAMNITICLGGQIGMTLTRNEGVPGEFES